MEHASNWTARLSGVYGTFPTLPNSLHEQNKQNKLVRQAAILDFFITQYDGTTLERHARRWQGRELAYVKCLETNSIRPCGKEQPFWALRLQVENCSSIVDAFSALLKPEIMKGTSSLSLSLSFFLSLHTHTHTHTGDNAIMNETLGRKTDSERGTILSQLPEFLTIQLQRFTFDLKTLRQIKLNNVIKFPFVLNLTDVMSSAVATQMATSTSDKTKYIYDLHAVVIHLGSVTSGHYFAYVLNVCLCVCFSLSFSLSLSLSFFLLPHTYIHTLV